MAKPTLYDILHLRPDATREQIRKAYKKMASKHHPDKEGGDVKQFQMIQHAYEVLYDPQSKEHYDKHGEAPKNNNGKPSQLQMAMTDLASMFMQILQNHMDTLQYLPVFEKMANELNKVKTSHTNNIIDQQKKLKQFDKMIKRITKRDEDSRDTGNIFVNAINQGKEGAERSIKNSEDKIEVIDLMIELLADYEFEMEIQQTRTTTFTGGTGTSTFTF